MAKVIKWLSTTHRALNSNPSTSKTTKNESLSHLTYFNNKTNSMLEKVVKRLYSQHLGGRGRRISSLSQPGDIPGNRLKNHKQNELHKNALPNKSPQDVQEPDTTSHLDNCFCQYNLAPQNSSTNNPNQSSLCSFAII
jgi:hypothetical protein